MPKVNNAGQRASTRTHANDLDDHDLVDAADDPVLVYGEVIASDTPERIKWNAAVQQAYLGTEVA